MKREHSAGARPTRVRIWILCLILFLSVVAYADRSILSISGSAIKDEFGLSAIQLGLILAAFSWAYVIGQIPGGLLLDRFGAKKVYGVTLALWSVSTIAMGFVGEFAGGMTAALVLMFTLRFALGLIEAPSFPANARVVIMWFPSAERGRASSLFSTAQYFAVAIFSPLSGWLVSRFGWEWPFFVLGGIGVLAVFVWAAYMREPRNHPGVSESELRHIVDGGGLVDIDASHTLQARPPINRAMFKTLLSSRMLWCAYLGQYCTIALSYFFITWFPIYLVQARGMNILDAGFATIAPALFGFLGGISGGYISDMLIKRGWSISWARKTPYIVGMLMAASLIMAAAIPSNVGIIAIMSFAFFGKGVAAGAGTWTVISDTAPKEAVGLAGAIFNGIGNIAGFVTPLLFGVIVGLTGSYSIGLVFVGAHCVVAALLFLFVMGPINRVGEAQTSEATREAQKEARGIKAV
ncbi:MULTISPECIES: MFS transporter [Pantoea]|jgi:ACS family glucarate transporter-like MFS transporter|uniref:MFS transporter n=1 Tax=Pantoea TaxID=53335 RepID=UPI000EA28E59|nr:MULTISPECIES: MFS transporter [Pantoea]MBZ6386748.1 MFS transporter [Pantoea piersonii]MBZ6399574.1 MFS transporter [Pantoea piersonii]MBZ6425593.1 MFS transporter [Pantoea piersonii]NYB03379.1 MFS transporter [Pantoea piersonii]NYB08503.1 MFS transporter [Pantoea piersonii]